MPQEDIKYSKPLPARRGYAGDFYEYCRKHELRFQRCTDCDTWRHLPRDLCAKCASPRWEWGKSLGRGKVFSWTTVMQPMLPQFETPYSPVIVELEEGVRMVTWLVGVKPEELRLDLPVEVAFEEVTPQVTLPKFRIRQT